MVNKNQLFRGLAPSRVLLLLGLPLLPHFLNDVYIIGLSRGFITWSIVDGQNTATVGITKAIHLDPHLSWFTGYSYAPWFYRPEDGPLRHVLFNVYIAGSACLLEEALYRSFLINGLERVGMPTWKAASISLVVFSLIHLSGGASFVLGAFLVGGLYTLVYVKTRNILSLVVAHFLVDLSWVTGFDGVLSALISPYLS